jgi:hypothetical protein
MNSNEIDASKIDNKKDKIDYSNYSRPLMPEPFGQPSGTMNYLSVHYWSNPIQYYRDDSKLKP